MLIKIILLVIFLIAFFLFFYLFDWDNGTDIFQRRKDNTDSDKYKAHVIPTPDYISSNGNIVYCSTFQLAWNALKDEVVKEDITLAGQPMMAKKLNQSFFTKECLSENDYYVNYGFGREDIVNKINNDLVNKFGQYAPEKVIVNLRPDDLFIYAYLWKSLKFKYAFERLNNDILFHGANSSTRVKGFGIASFDESIHHALKEQVSVLHYKNDKDFVISLQTTEPDDEYLLAMVDFDHSLWGTYQAALNKIAGTKPDRLRETDTLQIPCMKFDINRKYQEIVNRPFVNEAWKGFYISQALQNIKFSADETGATIASEAKIIFSRESVKNYDSRKMIFDKPYLLVLKKKDHPPYLLIWVENAEILVK